MKNKKKVIEGYIERTIKLNELMTIQNNLLCMEHYRFSYLVYPDKFSNSKKIRITIEDVKETK